MIRAWVRISVAPFHFWAGFSSIAITIEEVESSQKRLLLNIWYYVRISLGSRFLEAFSLQLVGH